MCDMSALDNLVANTAYLKAQGGDEKELRKRRQSLALPKPEKCETIRASVGQDFESLCELQPIGKKLFRQHLNETPEYAVAAEFLDELNDWELAEGAAKDKACTNIINQFCKEGSKSFLSCLTGEALEKCKAVTEKDFEVVMTGKVKEAVREFLKGKPFTEYTLSPLFDKFLQWKEYEKQPITEKYFYEFRTLGKGGFGEVRHPDRVIRSCWKFFGGLWVLRFLWESPLMEKCLVVGWFFMTLQLQVPPDRQAEEPSDHKGVLQRHRFLVRNCHQVQSCSVL